MHIRDHLRTIRGIPLFHQRIEFIKGIKLFKPWAGAVDYHKIAGSRTGRTIPIIIILARIAPIRKTVCQIKVPRRIHTEHVVIFFFHKITAGFQIAVHVLCKLLQNEKVRPRAYINVLGIRLIRIPHQRIVQPLHIVLKIFEHTVLHVRRFQCKKILVRIGLKRRIEPRIHILIHLVAGILLDNVAAGQVIRRCLFNIDFCRFDVYALHQCINAVIRAVQIDLDKFNLRHILDSDQRKRRLIGHIVAHQRRIGVGRYNRIFFCFRNTQKRFLFTQLDRVRLLRLLPGAVAAALDLARTGIAVAACKHLGACRKLKRSRYPVLFIY